MPTRKIAKLQQRIFTDEEVRYLSERLRQAMGSTFSELAQRHGIRVEGHFRFMPLAARLVNARNESHLTLRELATALKVPQYRLADIEDMRTTNLSADVLVRYVEYVGLKAWFARWKRSNATLAQQLQLNDSDNPTVRSMPTRKSSTRR